MLKGKETMEMEIEVKIVFVPKEQTNEDVDLFRVSCDGLNSGWGTTLEKAIQNFDVMNYRRGK
jgi:hypothetical protein